MNSDCYKNALIDRTLEVFANSGPLNLSEWAKLSVDSKLSSAGPYLLHLHRSGLLYRIQGANGQLVYAISVRGIKRLSDLRGPECVQVKSRIRWK